MIEKLKQYFIDYNYNFIFKSDKILRVKKKICDKIYVYYNFNFIDNIYFFEIYKNQTSIFKSKNIDIKCYIIDFFIYDFKTIRKFFEYFI